MHYALYSRMHSKMMWSFSEFKEFRLKDLVSMYLCGPKGVEVKFLQKVNLVFIVFLYALKNDVIFKRFTLEECISSHLKKNGLLTLFLTEVVT